MKQIIKEIINSNVKKTHWYNEVLFKDCRKFWELKDELFDVVNLGSSSGVYDFDYQDCHIKGANWAIAPQSIIGDFIILKQYRRYLKDGATIIYPLCPFTAISGGINYIEDRCYSFLQFESIPGASYIRFQKIMALKNAPIYSYPLTEFLRDIFSWAFKKENPILKESEMKVNSDQWMKGWMSQFNISSMEDYFVKDHLFIYNRTVDILNQMICYCSKEHLKLVLVIPPVYHTLAEKFTPKSREQLFNKFISDANGKNEIFLNFFDASSFINDNSLFSNSYFLNKKGARKFTNSILDHIKKI